MKNNIIGKFKGQPIFSKPSKEGNGGTLVCNNKQHTYCDGKIDTEKEASELIVHQLENGFFKELV